MYNKLFTKILDSSIWLESTPTRIVWLTMIAVMDQDGFAQFAASKNVAHRARVTNEEAEEALKILEGPDPDSSNPDNDGRRLERVPGGWLVLNADKHREIVTGVVQREQNRIRVQRFRDKQRNSRVITESLPAITCNTSEAETEAVTEEEALPVISNKLKRENKLSTTGQPEKVSLSPAAPTTTQYKNPNTDPFNDPEVTERAGRFIERYQALYGERRNGARYAVRPTRDYAAAVTLCQTWPDDGRLDKLAICFLTTDHKFAEEGSRTIPQFLALASWCDGKLAEWEKSNGNGARA